MASISSVISLFVLLLATYCYSVPVVINYDFTTAGYELATGKSVIGDESTPFALPEEYTTIRSSINQKREQADKKDESDSDELTTQWSSIKSDHKKRFSSVDATSTPFEATSEISKRSAKHDHSDSESEEKTTQRSSFKVAHQKRQSFDQSTSTPIEANFETTERPVDEELSGKFTTQRSVIVEAFPKRDSSDEATSSPFEATSIFSERSLDSEKDADSQSPSEQSVVERDVDSDSFTTFESSTQFNDRVSQLGERESVDIDTTTDFKPTSSDESFSQATGLLREREGEQPIKGKLEVEQPQMYYRKTETIVPGKITKTELRREGQNQSYKFQEIPVEQQVSSFSEGTTEENDSKTNADN